MAFLTGVNLETHLAAEELALAIPKRRPPRRRKQLALEDASSWKAKAICNQEKPVEYGSLLKAVGDMQGGNDDPLEELRRRIKRTRSKMESQQQVMNGFLSDVREMQQRDRSFFSQHEFETPSSPAAALVDGYSSKPAALPPSASSPAILAPSASSTEIVQRQGAPVARPSSASNSRVVSLRSDSGRSRRLGESRSQPALTAASRSQPALTAAAVESLHQVKPLALPQRRAPPGCGMSDLDKSISYAAAARHKAIAASGAAAGTTGRGGPRAKPFLQL